MLFNISGNLTLLDTKSISKLFKEHFFGKAEIVLICYPQPSAIFGQLSAAKIQSSDEHYQLFLIIAFVDQDLTMIQVMVAAPKASPPIVRNKLNMIFSPLKVIVFFTMIIFYHIHPCNILARFADFRKYLKKFSDKRNARTCCGTGASFARKNPVVPMKYPARAEYWIKSAPDADHYRTAEECAACAKYKSSDHVHTLLY